MVDCIGNLGLKCVVVALASCFWTAIFFRPLTKAITQKKYTKTIRFKFPIAISAQDNERALCAAITVSDPAGGCALVLAHSYFCRKPRVKPPHQRNEDSEPYLLAVVGVGVGRSESHLLYDVAANLVVMHGDPSPNYGKVWVKPCPSLHVSALLES